MAFYPGTDGNDVLNGTPLADSLSGYGGDDSLDGGGGADWLDGGDGNDVLRWTDIEAPSVWMDGGLGHDVFHLRDAHNATVIGGEGDDTLSMSTVRESMVDMGAGNDSVGVGAISPSLIMGGDGDDTLSGYANNSTVLGGDGNDWLQMNGSCVVDGGAGNDTLAALWDTTMTGGAGADLYYLGALGFLWRTETPAVITDFDAADGDRIDLDLASVYLSPDLYDSNLFTGGVLRLQQVGAHAELQFNFGTPEEPEWLSTLTLLDVSLDDDSISKWFVQQMDPAGDSTPISWTGSAADQQFTARDGNDSLNGAGGNDWLHGGYGGSDSLDGGDGNDSLMGGNGNDVIDGGYGTDIIDGGSAHDLIRGQAGNDSICGSSGNDTIWGGSGDDVIDDPAFPYLTEGGVLPDRLTYQGVGDDVLIGGAGSDSVHGGYGSDIYGFGRGSQMDVIYETDSDEGVDQLRFGSGVAASQIWLQQQGDDLLISIIGTTDQACIKDWFDSSTRPLESFRLASGQQFDARQVDALVNAMASMTAPAPGQTALSNSQMQELQQVLLAVTG